MEYKYNLDKLHKRKEEIEQLSHVHEKQINRALPTLLKRVLNMHIERARLNTIQFFGAVFSPILFLCY
jgi:hypothetical protein